MEVTQIGEVSIDGTAVLHAEWQGDAPGSLDGYEVVRASGQGELVRRLVDDPFHRVDQLFGQRGSAALGIDLGGYVDGHEGRIQPAGLCPGVVEVPLSSRLGDILPRSVQPIRDVDVRVNDQQFVRQFLGTVGDRVAATLDKRQKWQNPKQCLHSLKVP